MTAIAYHRCGDLGDTECRASEDALVVAWRTDGDWTYEVVDEGTNVGLCGLQPSVVVDDIDTFYVGYLCKVPVDDRSEDRVFVAERLELFE
ncbi:MAG: hypothetical protein AAGH15_05530 [Myxococcota bacterium]